MEVLHSLWGVEMWLRQLSSFLGIKYITNVLVSMYYFSKGLKLCILGHFTIHVSKHFFNLNAVGFFQSGPAS